MVVGNLISAPATGKTKTARGGVWPPMGLGGGAIRYMAPGKDKAALEAAE
jgi:hypothetical protein